ncbi:MAG TPA: F0F1 ATP synthase subunit epsilon [Candidatus Absconditabacterales bacterium]|nr:F0F1 ATP synthase subunit epsilon [Candidatus Absconditabacterales bacterium]HMT27196.1 F0F1 ATP synthase subunit epsilon [Candidatus Absconditabacterales bacterium]
MNCKISSPENIFFEGKIKQITLPTEQGEISFLPGQNPIVTVLKPGIVKISPEETQKNNHLQNNNFLHEKGKILISVGKGMIFIDGQNIMVLTSAVTTSPKESEEKLKEMKNQLEIKVNDLKKKGSIEDIEKSMITLEKINADMRLLKIGKMKKTQSQ